MVGTAHQIRELGDLLSRLPGCHELGRRALREILRGRLREQQAEQIAREEPVLRLIVELDVLERGEHRDEEWHERMHAGE